MQSARLLLLCAALACVGAAAARAAGGACEEIVAACRSAGFAPGDARSGNGLELDCVAPILQGGTQPRRASRPLPQIDAKIVAACRAQDPGFGQDRGAAAAPAQLPTAPQVEAAPLTPHAAAPGAPNIVFILTDDLATNLLQFMPHVQKMQREGVTFANYFVSDSLCCPSRSSIFTGRYPHDTGIFTNTGQDGGYTAFFNRGHERVTFATALAAAGYRTAMLGKYLNGYRPPQDPEAPGWSSWGVGGSTGYAEFNYNLNEDGRNRHFGSAESDYLTDVLSGLAVRFIRQSQGKPFLIEVATYAPHAPYVPAPRDANAFPDLHAPRSLAFNAAPDASSPGWLRNLPPLSAADLGQLDQAFRKRAQSVLAVDKMIGELEAAVAAIGAEKNTYFVFSSDNGLHIGEFRLMPGKMTPYDFDVRVPLVVTGPGVPAGRVIDQVAQNIDLCPTFEELAHAQASGPIDGASLVPLVHGDAIAEWRTAALIEHHGPHKDPSDPDAPAARSGNPTSYEALRTPTALYVEYNDGTREYHDLAADPDEMHNTYAGLPQAQKAALAASLGAFSICHDAKACWAASRPAKLAAN